MYAARHVYTIPTRPRTRMHAARCAACKRVMCVPSCVHVMYTHTSCIHSAPRCVYVTWTHDGALCARHSASGVVYRFSRGRAGFIQSWYKPLTWKRPGPRTGLYIDSVCTARTPYAASSIIDGRPVHAHTHSVSSCASCHYHEYDFADTCRVCACASSIHRRPPCV
jgi:hypothetical protein